jgi:hypothetical protein
VREQTDLGGDALFGRRRNETPEIGRERELVHESAVGDKGSGARETGGEGGLVLRERVRGQAVRIKIVKLDQESTQKPDSVVFVAVESGFEITKEFQRCCDAEVSVRKRHQERGGEQ